MNVNDATLLKNPINPVFENLWKEKEGFLKVVASFLKPCNKDA